MKKLISFIVLIIYCGTVMKTVVPYFEYFLNHDFIAEVLCTNNEKPELECNGKCYLKEQISKANEEDRNGKRIPVTEFDKFPVIFSESDHNFLNIFNKDKNTGCFDNIFLISLHSSKPLTPPPQS